MEETKPALKEAEAAFRRVSTIGEERETKISELENLYATKEILVHDLEFKLERESKMRKETEATISALQQEILGNSKTVERKVRELTDEVERLVLDFNDISDLEVKESALQEKILENSKTVERKVRELTDEVERLVLDFNDISDLEVKESALQEKILENSKTMERKVRELTDEVERLVLEKSKKDHDITDLESKLEQESKKCAARGAEIHANAKEIHSLNFAVTAQQRTFLSNIIARLMNSSLSKCFASWKVSLCM